MKQSWEGMFWVCLLWCIRIVAVLIAVALALVLIAIFASCSASPPTTPIATLSKAQAVKAIITQKVSILPLKYPPVILTNYWWDLQATTDLVNWVTIQTNCGPDDLWVTNTGGFMAFRMHGRSP